ncbi:MAG TPA: Uma2 family endonuclease [Gemmatimonadaceae bacterium]|nr:Uma2 family endonuclease [Gemmatimonadaceae bacterium]
MPATHPQRHWTADLLHAMPDDGLRYEIIDGALFVTPSPTPAHQSAVLQFAIRLDAYLRDSRVGYVWVAPGDVEFRSDTLVQPDVFVVPPTNGARPVSWRDAGRPLLVIEVVSPSTAAVDRVRKRALYQREGVPEYWIADLDARVIERWRPGDERPEILSEAIRWEPAGAEQPLTIALPEFWTQVFGG